MQPSVTSQLGDFYMEQSNRECAISSRSYGRIKKKNKNMSGPKSWERSTSTDLFPCQTRMEAGESLCANESVWMNRYLLVYLLLAWLPSFDPATDVNAQSRLELLRVSCFLNASISSGRVLLFREAAGCQGFQLAFGGYMTFLQCSSKI